MSMCSDFPQQTPYCAHGRYLITVGDRVKAALTTTDTIRARLLETLLHEALEPGATAAIEAAEIAVA